jgi:hypothetical protein
MSQGYPTHSRSHDLSGGPLVVARDVLEPIVNFTFLFGIQLLTFHS